MVPVVVELGLGPLVSKASNSDFLEGDTGTIGGDVEATAAGIENPITEDVGRALRVAGPEDGDVEDEEVEEVGGRRSSAHDFLPVAGASGTGGGTTETAGPGSATAGVVGVIIWVSSESVIVARPS